MDDEKFVKEKYLLGKIKLTPPSEAVTQSYLVNSHDELKAAKIMAKQNLLKQSVGHSYYAMYLSLQALLYKCGIKSEDHTTTIILQKLIFGKSNQQIKKAKKLRINAQYYTNIEIPSEDCQELLKEAEDFNNEMEKFIS